MFARADPAKADASDANEINRALSIDRSEHGKMLDAQVWSEDVWGEERNLAGKLQPWSTSWGVSSEKPPPAQAPRPRSKRVESAGRRSPTDRPMHLANRVANRPVKMHDVEEAMDAAGPYHLRKDDEFPGTPADEESQHFFVTKKVKCPPHRDMQQQGRRAGDKAAAQATGAKDEKFSAPHLQLHKGEADEGQAEMHKRDSIPMDMTIEAASILQPAAAAGRADIFAKVPARARRAQDLERDASPERDHSVSQQRHSEVSPYVLHGKPHVATRTWLQEAQDRSHQAGEEFRLQRQAVAADRHAAGQQGLEKEPLFSVPAGVVVQSIILERQEEKDKERVREKVRGAMVEGTALTMDRPAQLERKESRLRAMLREAKGRKPIQLLACSPLSNETPSNQLWTPGPENVEWGSSQRNTNDTPVTVEDPNGGGGATAQSLREEFNRIMQHQQIGAPEQKLRILAHAGASQPASLQTVDTVDKAEDSQPRADAVPEISVIVMDADQKRRQANNRRRAAHRPQDPFCLVRLEDQRKERMEDARRQAKGPSASILSQSPVATTVAQVNIPPRSLLRGQAFGTNSAPGGLQASAGDDVHHGRSSTPEVVTDGADIHAYSGKEVESLPSLPETLPVQKDAQADSEFGAVSHHPGQEGSPLYVGKVNMGVRRQHLESSNGQMRVTHRHKSSLVRAPGMIRHSPRFSGSRTSDGGKGGKEQEVLKGKPKPEQPEVERCHKGNLSPAC